MERTLEEWIKDATSEQIVSLWGDKVTFSPKLCSTVIGDGKQLIYVQPIGSRPYYWLLLIDSKTDVYSDDFDIDEYLEPLGEFTLYPELSEDGFLFSKENGEYQDVNTYEEYEGKMNEYPNFEWDGGSWGEIVNMKNKEKV